MSIKELLTESKVDSCDFCLFCFSEVHLARCKEAARKTESFTVNVNCMYN